MYRYDFTKMAYTTGYKPPKLYKSPSSDQMWYAIAHAETDFDSNKDGSWIRTKVRPKGGSTAYGPVQLTGTKAADYMRRYGKELSVFNDFYNNTMSPMWKQFAHHGNNKNRISDYNPIYDYGGTGTPLTQSQKHYYKGFSAALMDIDAREVAKAMPHGTPTQLLEGRIARWRGVPRTEDPKYYQKVNDYLYKHYPELYQEN